MFNKKSYYQAVSMAEYILEGHTREETSKEFGVSRTLVTNRINMLATYKPSLYKKAIEKLHEKDNYEGKVISI